MSDTFWKTPPKAKIYEALSAVIDDRVQLVADGQAKVRSSDLSKSYTVVWDQITGTFGSNDNASYWVGYIGYPIIATLLKLGRLKFDEQLAAPLKGVNWNKLNQAYKRRYDDAVDYVLEQAGKSGADVAAIRGYADQTFSDLKALKLGRMLPPGEPPKRG